MKILLDECVPWPMHKIVASHEYTTAQKCGWGGIKNAELLRLAESRLVSAPLELTWKIVP